MNFTKLSPYAITPTRKHPTDAGLDLYACLKTNEKIYNYIYIFPHSYYIVPTKIAVQIPEGYVGLVWPKSKNDHLIGGGVIDSGYTGEIFVKVMNISDNAQEILHGQAVGQLLIQKIETPELVELTKEAFYLNETERGASGGIVTQFESTLSSKITEVE